MNLLAPSLKTVTHDPLLRILDTARLDALYRTDLLDSPAESAFDRITALAARVLHAPVVIVSLVDGDRQFFKSEFGLPAPLGTCRQSPLTHSFCKHVVGSDKMLVVCDAVNDPLVCSNGATVDWKIAAYLGIPLRAERNTHLGNNNNFSTGHVLGSFAVIDMVPRQWSEEEISLVQDFAALIETEIDLRASAKESDNQAQIARNALEQQKQSEARFCGVTEASPNGVFITDAVGACRYVNPKLVEITGTKTTSDLLGDGFFHTLHPDDRERVLRRWRAALRTKSEFASVHRLVLRDRTGWDVWVSVKAAPLQNNGPEGSETQPGWAGTVEDISDRKAAEDALAETSRFIHQITETVPLIITVTDVREHQNVYTNREFTNALGYSAEEAAEQTTDAAFLRAKMHPDDLPLYLSHVEQVAQQPQGEPPLVCEYRVRHADGHWCWFRSRDTVFERDAQTGAPSHFLGIAEDITSAKQYEESLVALTQQLQRSNASLQEFASVASHDLQEPLRKVQTFGDRLKTRYGHVLDKDGADYLDRMLAASARMQALIDALLLYSRVSSKVQVFERTDLNEIVKEVLGDLETRIQQTGGIVHVEPLPCVAADPMQMRQLLQNLIGNALKFHRPGVAPVVCVTGEEGGQNPHDAISKENRKLCRIVIQDNGIGFEKQYAERVFDVFERLHTRSQYEGTGMGLAICRKIAHHHGGSIAAQSTPGQGTRMIITLPLSPVDNLKNLSAPKPAISMNPTERNHTQ